MDFGGFNILAVCIATVAGFMVGGIWYHMLARPWMDALGIDSVTQQGGGVSPIPFVIALVADFVMAVILAGLIGHLGDGQVTIRNGVISAAFVWLGFVATTIVVNNAFAMRPFKLTAIDAGHWLAVLAVQGGIIGWFGIAAP